MELVPIKESVEENTEFISDPDCQETLQMTIDFYRRVGYAPPWICYYVRQDGEFVGNAGIKGRPVNNTVEIAYGTMEKHREKGIGTRICGMLVDLCLRADPSVRITARTLPQNNFSTRILEKNGFQFSGMVNDPEDGDVWEWVFVPDNTL